jgi:hypothetical protein
MRRLAIAIAALAVAWGLAAPAGAEAAPCPKGIERSAADEPGSCYLVGVAARSINPDPDGTFAGQPVYLGGYGIGSPPISSGRPATGILGDGIEVRAISISDGADAVAVADIETQGWFAAVRDGPYGLVDIRREVERRTDGALPAGSVVVQTNHSHGAPDTIGVWGGVPDPYLEMIAERTVEAIVEAFRSARPGRLHYGVADGRDLLSNQFEADPANEAMDAEVRVLQARGAGGRPFATLLNFSAHTTVLGSGNTRVTGDWVQAANELLERRLGGEAVTVVGTLGRTQPADRGCADPGLEAGPDRDLCALREYAGRVVDRAADAAAAAEPLAGPPAVAAHSYLIQDPATNPVILGLSLAGEPAGIPINRSLAPPWMIGNVIGTVTASAHIGDVLLSGIPGEAYPQIPLKVTELVPARGHLTAGLANDQLGYLIAPVEAYPEPVRRSLFNQEGDEVSPVDNDNYFFNVSHTLGERVTCSLLRGAGEVLGEGSTFRDRYERCTAFPNDAALPPGADASWPLAP